MEDNKVDPAVGRLARAWITIGWAGVIAVGVAIEFVQRETGYRTFEYANMGADCDGIVLAGCSRRRDCRTCLPCPSAGSGLPKRLADSASG